MSTPDTAPYDWSWETQGGPVVFAPFKAETDYLAADKQFMLNLRVSEIDELIASLTAAGIAVETRPEWNDSSTANSRASTIPRAMRSSFGNRRFRVGKYQRLAGDSRKVTKVAPLRVEWRLEMPVFGARVAKVTSYTPFSGAWIGGCVDGLKERAAEAD